MQQPSHYWRMYLIFWIGIILGVITTQMDQVIECEPYVFGWSKAIALAIFTGSTAILGFQAGKEYDYAKWHERTFTK